MYGFLPLERHVRQLPISVANGLKSDPGSTQRCREVFRVIDEKHSIFDVMFLAEFPEKPLSQCGRSRRIQPHVQEFVLGSTAAYSQNCWPLNWITVSLSAT